MKNQATTADAYKLIHEGILAFARAERHGIRIDVDYCEKMTKNLTRKIEHLQSKIEKTSFYRRWEHIYRQKTNIHSGHQLSHILYKNMKLKPPKQTASGEGSTDEEALKQLKIPALDLIVKIKKLEKVKDTYLGAFIREQTEGIMHPFFNLHTVRTYRSSSSDPNFQNIPKRDKESMEICRRAIIPRECHMLLEADFSSLEVNIGACYHKDPMMLKYLRDKNSDMHLDMAKQIYIFDELDKKIPSHSQLRFSAKNGFVFPQFYGDYYGNNAPSLCQSVKLPQGKWKEGQGIELPNDEYISSHLIRKGIKSYNQFVNHIKDVEYDFWNNKFKVYSKWKKNHIQEYRRTGHLTMLTGFTCAGIMRDNEISNYPIQGTAFHCLLYTFIELDKVMRKEKWKSRLIGQIHDSIIMDVLPSELEHVKETIYKIVREKLQEKWDWIVMPLDIDIDVFDIDKPWIN